MVASVLRHSLQGAEFLYARVYVFGIYFTSSVSLCKWPPICWVTTVDQISDFNFFPQIVFSILTYFFSTFFSQYIHNYQTGLSELHHDLIFLVRCCMEISLNTMEASPHTCPLLPPGGQVAAPPIRRLETEGEGGGFLHSGTPSNHALPS